MAKAKTEASIPQSLIDRLSNEEPPPTRAISIRLFRESLKRDVGWLFNSRRPPMLQLDPYPNAAASVLNYGLPDSHGSIAGGSHDPELLAALLLRCLCLFEPRLRQPRVSVARTGSSSRTLRFRIEAQIALGNSLEDIAFNTLLDQITGQYEVQ